MATRRRKRKRKRRKAGRRHVGDDAIDCRGEEQEKEEEQWRSEAGLASERARRLVPAREGATTELN
jgi:hypothetical protein